MPVMIRKRGKGRQVALSILGKPANEPSGRQKSKSQQTDNEKEIDFQESSRVK